MGSPWLSSAWVTLAPTATTSATPLRRSTATSRLPAPRWSATCPPMGTPSTTPSRSSTVSSLASPSTRTLRTTSLRAATPGGQPQEPDVRVLQEPERAHEGGAGDAAVRVQAALPGAHVHGGGAEADHVRRGIVSRRAYDAAGPTASGDSNAGLRSGNRRRGKTTARRCVK